MITNLFLCEGKSLWEPKMYYLGTEDGFTLGVCVGAEIALTILPSTGFRLFM